MVLIATRHRTNKQKNHRPISQNRYNRTSNTATYLSLYDTTMSNRRCIFLISLEDTAEPGVRELPALLCGGRPRRRLTAGGAAIVVLPASELASSRKLLSCETHEHMHLKLLINNVEVRKQCAEVVVEA